VTQGGQQEPPHASAEEESDMAQTDVVLAGSGNIGTVIGGVSPGWGPFGALGRSATTVIDLTMAVVLVICFGVAIVGAAKQRVGSSGRNSMHSEEGKGLLISGLAGAFIVGSLATVFTVIYGMSI